MFGHADQMQPNFVSQQAPDGALSDDSASPAEPAIDLNSLTDVAAAPSVPAPAPAMPAPSAPVASEPELPPVPAVTPASPVTTDQLLDIKQQALQQLTPLVGHLQQEPEDKFRTTMMMIQAADNDGLIKTAYDAALQIKDDKVRAQALLDIVNEINYFTHTKSVQG